MTSPGRVWIDISNPPQVQYLLPFRDAFAAHGVAAVITGRAYGMTPDLLRARNANATIIGREFGDSAPQKILSTLARAAQLRRVGRGGRPRAALSSSRAGAIASWSMRVPHFALIDYEHVNLGAYLRAGSTLMFPEAIPVEFFEARGFDRRRLMPFSGIKEDITFSSFDIPRAFPPRQVGAPTRLLVRPPGEQSHYYRAESGEVTRALLAHLAPRRDIQVVYSPRRAGVDHHMLSLPWANAVQVVGEATGFPGALADVDAVLSGGGTMVREAAFIGLPAFSTFRGEAGAVDEQLAAMGRLIFIRERADFDRVLPVNMVSKPPLSPRGGVLDHLTEEILARTAAGTD